MEFQRGGEGGGLLGDVLVGGAIIRGIATAPEDDGLKAFDEGGVLADGAFAAADDLQGLLFRLADLGQQARDQVIERLQPDDQGQRAGRCLIDGPLDLRLQEAGDLPIAPQFIGHRLAGQALASKVPWQKCLSAKRVPFRLGGLDQFPAESRWACDKIQRGNKGFGICSGGESRWEVVERVALVDGRASRDAFRKIKRRE